METVTLGKNPLEPHSDSGFHLYWAVTAPRWETAPRLCSSKPPAPALLTAFILLITCCSQARCDPAPHAAPQDGIFVQTNPAASQEGKLCSPRSKHRLLKAELVAQAEARLLCGHLPSSSGTRRHGCLAAATAPLCPEGFLQLLALGHGAGADEGPASLISICTSGQ